MSTNNVNNVINKENLLMRLYCRRIALINNIYNYTPSRLGIEIDNIENRILKEEKGMALLINLYIIAENRRALENLTIKNEEQRKFKFLKLIECANICEVILNLKKDALLSNEEIIYKKWLNISGYMDKFTKHFINEFKENLLFCGCNKSIS